MTGTVTKKEFLWKFGENGGSWIVLKCLTSYLTHYYSSGIETGSFLQMSYCKKSIASVGLLTQERTEATQKRRKTRTQSNRNITELECGPLPNVMTALSNIGSALCSTPQSLTPSTGVPCSNAAKTRNPLKLAGVPQTTGRISAASGPKFTILRALVKEILLLNIFFPIVDTFLSSEDIARQICVMVPRWRFFDDFLRPVFFSEPRAARFRPAP